MAESAGFAPDVWHRLSPWSIVHFAEKAIVRNVGALIYAGGPATFGASRWGPVFAWSVPIAILVIVLIASAINYAFFRYRIVEDSIQVRRGALFKQHLDLSFHRIQNVSIEHPLYFRPLGRVTLKIDSAGATEEEVNLAALAVSQGEAVRDYILRQKRRLEPAAGSEESSPQPESAPEEGTLFFRRSLTDLVIHGLTNNRSFIVVAGIIGFLAQSGLSPGDLAARLGIDFDVVVVAGLSLVRLAMLILLSFILTVGVIAFISVIVSIVTFYGFSMARTADSLTIRRGLLTKHEIHLRKSRIQTITLRQDWLDRLLGRRNIVLERITHSQGPRDPNAAQKQRILVPSVRIHETAMVTDEILPGCRVEQLAYTPISVRYLYKLAAIVSAIYVIAVAVSLALPDPLSWTTSAALALWPLHLAYVYLSWKRGGLAIDGDVVVARSGAIGIDYRLFAAHKIQDVTHIQSLLMRRHGLSSIRFHTASTAIRVPHMPTAFIRKVVDYCVFRVESTSRSWM